MKEIKLSEYDIYDLLTMTKYFAEAKTADYKQALEDEKAGKPLAFFDNYADYLAGLDADNHKAKQSLKNIQAQTGIIFLTEEAIDRL